MNLFRLLLLGALTWLFTRLLRRIARRPADTPTAQRPSSPPATTYEPMLRCARCGVHTPQASLSADGLCQHCRS